MDKEKIIRIIREYIEMEDEHIKVLERCIKNTWNPFNMIFFKRAKTKYIHSYVTLSRLLEEIEERF